MSIHLVTWDMEYEIGRTESVSTAVVRAVSAIKGREPCSLRPLTDVLDTDALNALFNSQMNGQPRTGGRLSFVYSDCCVSIDNGEYLTIEPLKRLPRASTDAGSSDTGTR